MAATKPDPPADYRVFDYCEEEEEDHVSEVCANTIGNDQEPEPENSDKEGMVVDSDIIIKEEAADTEWSAFYMELMDFQEQHGHGTSPREGLQDLAAAKTVGYPPEGMYHESRAYRYNRPPDPPDCQEDSDCEPATTGIKSTIHYETNQHTASTAGIPVEVTRAQTNSEKPASLPAASTALFVSPTKPKQRTCRLSAARAKKKPGAKTKSPSQVPAPSWETRFQDLKAFKARVGHVNPRSTEYDERPLARWLAMQRNNFKQRVKFFPSRIQSLRDLGCSGFEDLDVAGGEQDDEGALLGGVESRGVVTGSTTSPVFVTTGSGVKPRTKKQTSEWQIRFQQLKEFKEQYGHVTLNKNTGSETERALAAWLARERDHYKRRKGWLPSRIQALSNLGITFEEPNEEEFTDAGGEASKQPIGHPRVPNGAASSVSLTVFTPCQPSPPSGQRSRSLVTSQQHRQTEKDPSATEEEEGWMERFRAVEEFRNKLGRNPGWGWKKSEMEKELGNWITKQQIRYRQGGQLSTEQIQRLRSIDPQRFRASNHSTTTPAQRTSQFRKRAAAEMSQSE